MSYRKNKRKILSAFLLSFLVFNLFGMGLHKISASVDEDCVEGVGKDEHGECIDPNVPFFTYLGLEANTKLTEPESPWGVVRGSLASGFTLATNPSNAVYYLRLTENTASNMPLARGVYSFTLFSHPDGYVPDLAPAFHLYADGQGEITLLNGPDREPYWRVNSNMPVGQYNYQGNVYSLSGNRSEDIFLSLTIERDINSPSNTTPVAQDDSYRFVKNTPLVVSPNTILDNDTDADNGPQALTPRVEVWPSHGTMIMGTDGSFRYVPDTDFEGLDYFTYKAFDGSSSSNLARVHLRVNQAPVAVRDSYSTPKNTRLLTAPDSILDNDYDPDPTPNTDPIALEPQVDTWPSHGTMIMSTGGRFSYIPHNDFVGNDFFTYRAFDGELVSNLVQVDIAVGLGANQAPVAVNDTYSVVTGEQLNVDAASGVLANDTDIDSPQAMTSVLLTNISHGNLTLASNGSFNYQATGGFTGTDTFTYRAFDGLNYSNVATSTITVNAPSGGGGGGGGGNGGGSSSRRPASANVVINNNAATTNSLVVTLTMSATNMISNYGPLEMKIGNFSDLNSVAWVPYSTSTTWTLLSGAGQKTVYVQFRNSRGTSNLVSDSINYSAGQVLGEKDCSSNNGALIAKANTKDATVYFIGSDCKKYPFPDPKTYYTWYENFQTVRKVDISELDFYTNGELISYRPGTKLVTHPDTNKVYAVEANGVLREIPNPAIARSLYGPNWQSMVQDVIIGYFFTSYTIGEPMTANSLPDGTLVKANNDDTIYLLENGKKRPFVSKRSFERHYFRYNNVVVKNTLDNYDNGNTIENLETTLSPYRLAY